MPDECDADDTWSMVARSMTGLNRRVRLLLRPWPIAGCGRPLAAAAAAPTPINRLRRPISLVTVDMSNPTAFARGYGSCQTHLLPVRLPRRDHPSQISGWMWQPTI